MSDNKVLIMKTNNQQSEKYENMVNIKQFFLRKKKKIGKYIFFVF